MGGVVSTLIAVAVWGAAGAAVAAVLGLCVLRVRAGERYRHPVPDVGGNVAQAVVITGCDSGIGRTTALRMARGGFLVLASVFDKKVRLPPLHGLHTLTSLSHHSQLDISIRYTLADSMQLDASQPALTKRYSRLENLPRKRAPSLPR